MMQKEGNSGSDGQGCTQNLKSTSSRSDEVG